MKLDRAIEDVQRVEAELAGELRKVGERHAADADVYHVSHLLAARCTTQLERLAPHAERYGVTGSEETGKSPAVVERLRRMSSELLGAHELSGAALLDDLRELYVRAHRVELAWLILGQAAHAARDTDLLADAKAGSEEAERRWKWLRTKVKEASPQVLVAG